MKGLISISGSLNGGFADSLYEKDSFIVNTGKSLKKLDRLDPNIDAFDSNYEISRKDGLFVGSVLKDLLELRLQSILPIDPTIKLDFKSRAQQLVNLPNLTDKRIKSETEGRRLDKIIDLTSRRSCL